MELILENKKDFPKVINKREEIIGKYFIIKS